MAIASSRVRYVTIIRTVLIFVSLVALGRQASAASITVIKGSTQGCFGGGCGAFEASTTDSDWGLAFAGVSSFDVVTDATGAATNIVLGRFSRVGENDPDFLQPLDFSLAVTFSLPMVAGDTFQAIIQGKNSGGGGPLNIDFNKDWQLFTYSNGLGKGSFEFAVLDIPQLTKNDTVDIIGSVRGATFVPDSGVVTNAAVPEPTTMILLGTGVAAVLRRRRKSSTAR